MTDAATCPSDRQLQEFVTDAAPHDSVRAHVDVCSACRDRIEVIRDDEAFLTEFVRHASAAGATNRNGAAAVAPTGRVVPGYQVGRIIGRGGQAIVYEAEQDTTRRRVAVKMLLDGAESRPERAERFEREIRLAAGLKHPAIVTVYDSGIAPDGHPYCVMEYVAGCPVTTWCEEQRPESSPRAILALFARICDAVGYSHQHGVMHRDLKPSNVLIDADGNPRILDFGLAKALEPDGEKTLTASGEFLGTLAYAAPEQVRHDGALADVRTDVYALGVMLYELLAGTLPYPIDGSVANVVASITEHDPAPPSTHAPGIDDEVDTIVLKALAKDPERRYDSASALLDDIESFLAGRAIAAKRDSAWYLLRTAARRHRVVVGAAIAIVLLLVAFAVTMTTLYGQKQQRAQELAISLRTSNIERGRLMVRGGNVAEGEEILWREHLAELAERVEADDRVEAAPRPGLPVAAAHWALWELYARYPCRATALLHEGPVSALAFGEAGQVVTAGADGILTRWNPETAEAPRLRIGPAGTDIALSGDGRRVARWNIDDLEVFEIATRDWIGKINAYRLDRATLSISRSGRHVVGAADRFVSVWTADGNHVREIQVQRAPRRIHAVAAGAEATRAVTAEDDLLKFFDQSSIRESASVRIEGAKPTPLAMSADGRFVAAVAGTRVHVFSADGQKIGVEPHADVVGAVDFAPDGSVIASGGWSRRVRVWEPGNEGSFTVNFGHRGVVTAVAVGPEGDLVASGDDTGTVKVWERGSGGVTRFGTPGVSNHAARIASSGAVIASCGVKGEDGGIVELRDARTGALRSQWEAEDFVVGLAVLPAGDRIVTCGFDGAVREREIANGAERVIFRVDARVRSVAVSPNGRTIAAGADETGDVWLANRAGDEPPTRLSHHRLRVPDVAFSADGSLLATASADGTAAIWDVGSRKLRRVLEGHAGRVRTARFHPEGRLLATGGDDRSVRLWDLETGEDVARLTGHEDDIFVVAFTPDGKILATGDRSGVVRLWDVAAVRELAILDPIGEAAPVMSLAFTPDGRGLLVATTQSMLARWDLTYYDRFIAGNLAYWTARLAPDAAAPPPLPSREGPGEGR